jgi:hypothetical protein
MRRWKRLTLIVVVVAAILFVAAVVAALALEPAAPAQTDLSWQVIANGGATMSGPSYTLMSTTGQPVAGMATGGDHTLLSGYWYGFQTFIRNLFMPFIIGG